MAFIGVVEDGPWSNKRGAEPSSADPEERWVDEHGDCMYRYALVRVRVPEVAEDLVQETLLGQPSAHEESRRTLFGAKLARRHPEKQNSRLLPQAWPGRGCKDFFLRARR